MPKIVTMAIAASIANMKKTTLLFSRHCSKCPTSSFDHPNNTRTRHFYCLHLTNKGTETYPKMLAKVAPHPSPQLFSISLMFYFLHNINYCLKLSTLSPVALLKLFGQELCVIHCYILSF